MIVVSALGKRTSDDDKVTDLLYLIYAYLQHHVDWTPLWKRICDRFIQVRDVLALQLPIEDELARIQKQLEDEKITEDYLVSRGEYLTAQLMAEYLGYQFIDAKDLIFFDYDGKIDQEKQHRKSQKHLKDIRKWLFQGFMGRTLQEKKNYWAVGEATLPARYWRRCCKRKVMRIGRMFQES